MREVPGSACRRRREAAARLREAGAGRLSDSFLLPAKDASTGIAQGYAAVVMGTSRGARRAFWLRVADVPFDLFAGHPRSRRREGVHFSLGPGLTADGEVHPAILLVQVEGPAEASRAELERTRGLVHELAEDVRETWLPERAARWGRACVAGVLRR